MSKVFILFSFVFALSIIQQQQVNSIVEACSSRTVPKPRPSTSSSSVAVAPSSASTSATITETTASGSTTTQTTTTSSTTPRPNITFPTYKCPATYDAWYCLNEATCFSIKIGDSIMYNCECAIGFMGPRCEYKELDGSYLPKRPRPILEKASIASGAICAVLFVLFIGLTLYLCYEQKSQNNKGIFDHHISIKENDDMYGGKDDNVLISKCRFCNDKRCCGDETYLIGASEKYRNAMLRQHIEIIPLSFAIKRSTKL